MDAEYIVYMNEEFKKHLEILQNKDSHYLGLNWQKSAAFFKKEAVAGRDISPAADALKNVFYESQQVPVMDEVSAALIYQSINQSDFSDLDGLIQNTAYPDFIFSVFLTVAENREHLEPAVPFLLSWSAKRKAPALPILKEIISKSSDRENLISESADFFLKKKKNLLPGFLKSLAGSNISINSEIHRLNHFFRSEKDLSILSESLPAIAESGADLSPLEENIFSLLKKRKKTQNRIFSRCICIHWIYRDQKDNLEKMISDRSPDIRYGSCSSIIFAIQKNTNDYFLKNLLSFLWDSEEEIRKTAADRLRIIEAENPEYILKLIPLKELIQKSPKISTELFNFLLFLAGTTARNAESILDISFLLDHPEKEKLAELCISKISGTETCRICLAIPRNKLYYWDFEVPEEILRLVPEKDFTEETPGCRRVCPVCGRRYHYRFITEYEDMSSSTEIRIEKLPPELSELPEEKEYLDQFLPVLHREMTHPEPKVRENAGFDLSVYYYMTEDYQNLFSLLGNFQDLSVQKGALKGISGRKLSEELISVLSELLKSPDSGIRSNAAEELASYYMQTDNIEGIKNLLSASDHIFTVSPTIQKAFFLRKESKIHFDVLYPKFLNLLNSSDSAVRRFADYFLAEMKPPEGSEEKIFLERLSHRNPEIRKEAALSLERKISKDFDPSFAFRPLLRLLKNRTTAWAAVSAFKKTAFLNYDLSRIIPFLIRQIKDRKSGGREDAVWTLSVIEEKRGFPDEFLKSLSPLLSFREDNVSYMAYRVFESAEKRGKDISFAEKHIRNFFQSRKENDYLKERSVYLLTDICIQKKDADRLKILLLHRNASVRYAASSRIYDSLQRGKDVSFCRDLIRQNTDHNYAFLKEISLKILG